MSSNSIEENETGGGGLDLSTARGREWPSVRQFNVFLENRLGGLMNVVRKFESADVRIVSLLVIDCIVVASIRMVFDDPERAVEILDRAKFPYTESDLIVVKLPDVDQPVLAITKALLQSEINIHYTYPLLLHVGYEHASALALYVEDLENATNSLQERGFELVTDNDLKDCE